MRPSLDDCCFEKDNACADVNADRGTKNTWINGLCKY